MVMTASQTRTTTPDNGGTSGDGRRRRRRRRMRGGIAFFVSSLAILTEVSSFVRTSPTRCHGRSTRSPPVANDASPAPWTTTRLFATITNSTVETASPPAFRRSDGKTTTTGVLRERGASAPETPRSRPKRHNGRRAQHLHRRDVVAIHKPSIIDRNRGLSTSNSNNNNNSDKNRNDDKNDQSRKKKRNPKEDEFRWLNWVYYQWKDVRPGQLTNETTLRQMIAAITRWARRRSPSDARRAEELLERIVQESLAGNPLLTGTRGRPSAADAASGAPLLTVSEFNAAMDAYGKIGDPEGVQRILRRMESLQRDGGGGGGAFLRLRPDAFSMSILATAWAKSRSPDAAQKAEAILQYMDLNGLVANTVTYNAVLNAIAVGNQVDKAMKAEDIVQQMKERSEKGQDCAPDVYTYQSLIQAWSKTTFPGAPQKAEEILRYMDESSERNKKLEPNAYCFTTVIHAWARSSEKNRARSAYNLLNALMRRSRDAGNRARHMKPNVKTFTAVLNACARPSDAIEALDAFAIAKLTMAELSLGVYGHPNFLSYAAFLSVCATALEAGPRRDSLVRQAFEDCAKAGEVGMIVLEKLHAAASPALVDELIGRYRSGNAEIQVPLRWKSNVRGEKASDAFMPTPKVTEFDVSKVSKSSQRRFEAVQRFQGQYGSMSGDLDEEILWRNGSF